QRRGGRPMGGRPGPGGPPASRPAGGRPFAPRRDDDARPPRGGFGGPRPARPDRRMTRPDDDERPDERRPFRQMGDLLYGRNAVLEALRAGREIRRVMVATGAHGEVITDIVDTARGR